MVNKNLDAAVVAAITVAAVVTLSTARCFTEIACEPTVVPTAAVPVKETQPAQVLSNTTANIPPTILYDVPLEANLQLHIIQVAESYGIDPAIIFAICYRESTYNPASVGDHGASFGLMQIQPKWHRDRMARLDCTDLLDPYQNVIVGTDYLAEQVARYSGDIRKALVAYNAGHYNGTITKYATVIMEMAEELRGANYEADK